MPAAGPRLERRRPEAWPHAQGTRRAPGLPPAGRGRGRAAIPAVQVLLACILAAAFALRSTVVVAATAATFAVSALAGPRCNPLALLVQLTMGIRRYVAGAGRAALAARLLHGLEAGGLAAASAAHAAGHTRAAWSPVAAVGICAALAAAADL